MEKTLKQKVIGIDEVGRGPLAGPAVVGAFCCEMSMLKKLVREGRKFAKCKLKDSKVLTQLQREKWNTWLQKEVQKGTCAISLSWKTAKEVDARGITVVIREAVAECAVALAPNAADVHVLLDGGLRAPKHYTQTTIIKGDSKEAVIALASIAAKVARDAYMSAISDGDRFLFAKHKGYGTREHRRVIRSVGIHSEHRRSFLKNILKSVKPVR